MNKITNIGVLSVGLSAGAGGKKHNIFKCIVELIYKERDKSGSTPLTSSIWDQRPEMVFFILILTSYILSIYLSSQVYF